MRKIIILFAFYNCLTTVNAGVYPKSYVEAQLKEAKTSIAVDISKIKAGSSIEIMYVGRPVTIYKRTQKEIKYLEFPNLKLADVNSANYLASIRANYGSTSSYIWSRLLIASDIKLEAKNNRSIKNSFFIFGGWSPHSGCSIQIVPINMRKSPGAAFHDPCSGVTYDSAGRALAGKLKGLQAGSMVSYNLYIPPHNYISTSQVKVGVPANEELPLLPNEVKPKYKNLQPTQQLLNAAKYNDLHTVKQALARGANVNYFKAGVGSPIDAAIIGSSLEIINLLIKHGAKETPNSRNVANFMKRNDVISIFDKMK